MKFAKTLENALHEEGIPAEWVEAAIQYKSLKKCINKVVKELQFLGLEQNTLKLFLEDRESKKVIEVDESETVPSNPIIAEYTITKSKNDNKSSITPVLKVTLNYDDDTLTDDHIQELGAESKRKLEALLAKSDDSDDEPVAQRVVEIKQNGHSLVLSPQSSSRREGSPVPLDEVPKPKNKSIDIYILLNSDTEFFHMLNKELENLDKFKTEEETKLIHDVDIIGNTVRTISNPNISTKKSDLYKWRELFKMYLDSEIYFRYNQTSTSSGERSVEQIKKNFLAFLSHVEKTGIVSSFKNKKSAKTFDQFMAMNYHLLKVLQFQSINSTAFRKILKKFDKQTSLGVKNKFPKLINDDHIFFSGASLAQSICYVIQTSILTVIPQLDDYTCPICTSVAFKPIKLECGHLFCVRCLVKLKQQKKANCPFCRHENAVMAADGGNLDIDAMALMKAYFPLEVKEKLKEREKERYDEMMGNSKCIIM